MGLKIENLTKTYGDLKRLIMFHWKLKMGRFLES